MSEARDCVVKLVDEHGFRHRCPRQRPIEVCLPCKNAEHLRNSTGNAKLLGIAVLVAIIVAVIAQSGWALIGGSALGGLVTVPLKPLIIARSKFNEHPAILAKKQEGYKLTNPSSWG